MSGIFLLTLNAQEFWEFFREGLTIVNKKCSTTGKPTHLFGTKCASLDSV
jgi:hypothetical protein